MNAILLPLVVFLAGCATPMSELLTEAKECTATSINPQGIIGKPTDEQSQSCWQKVNDRTVADAKRAAERDVELAARCPKGTIKWCRVYSRVDKRCECVSNDAVRDVFRGHF